MKRVLITGLSSYIGNAFEAWVREEPLEITKVSLRDESWKEQSWEGFDAILHVAGKAHADVGGATKEMQQEYYRINRDLTLEAVRKAKADGVHQFIYMSSIIVYGDSAPIGKAKEITKETVPAPANFYGDSKLQAEKAILPLQDEMFLITIIRPPMVYGKGSKGNFPKLVKLSQKMPIFPKIENQRSMIYIKNLCECIRGLIMTEQSGIFCPQNPETVHTGELMRLLRKAQGKELHLIPGLTPVVKLAGHVTGYVNKVFGNLTYAEELSKIPEVAYQRYSLAASIADMQTEVPGGKSVH